MNPLWCRELSGLIGSCVGYLWGLSLREIYGLHELSGYPPLLRGVWAATEPKPHVPEGEAIRVGGQ